MWLRRSSGAQAEVDVRDVRDHCGCAARSVVETELKTPDGNVLDVMAQILVSAPGPTPIVANQLYFLIKLLTRWFAINIIFYMSSRCALSQTMIGLLTVFNDMTRYDCYVSAAQCPLRSEHFH